MLKSIPFRTLRVLMDVTCSVVIEATPPDVREEQRGVNASFTGVVMSSVRSV